MDLLTFVREFLGARSVGVLPDGKVILVYHVPFATTETVVEVTLKPRQHLNNAKRLREVLIGRYLDYSGLRKVGVVPSGEAVGIRTAVSLKE